MTLAEIRAVVPQHLHQKSTLKGLFYACRDLLCVVSFYQFGVHIDLFSAWFENRVKAHGVAIAVKWALWSLYWYWQSLAFAACWCLAHEAGHGNLSPYQWINHTIGFTFHTVGSFAQHDPRDSYAHLQALLAPYFAWRSTHRAHHQATMSVERDENYVPRTRSDYNLPPAKFAERRDYHEIFEETPFYTLVRMMIMQLLGWQIYLFTDSMGSPRHPRGTNVSGVLILPGSVRTDSAPAFLAKFFAVQAGRKKWHYCL